MIKSHLLLIPGLGDRAWLYRLTVPLWRFFGYNVHVHQFGWNDGLAEFEEKQAQLVGAADRLPLKQLSVIGASAGGVAAINLLAARPEIRKVITIAAPLWSRQSSANALFADSFKQANKFLSQSDKPMKRKIVSVHGAYDNRVPVELSIRPGIHSVRLPILGHGPTIFTALTVFSKAIRRLLV